MKNHNECNASIKSFVVSDTVLIVISILLLFVLFLIQPDTRNSFPSYFSENIIVMLKLFILTWLLPFATLIVALLAFRNIFLTKETIEISKNTLKQMQLADQKTTSPMLNYDLSVGTYVSELHVEDGERPREIKLWEAKADDVEKKTPHYLNIKLKNMQDHPQGVAIDIEIEIIINFPLVESSGEIKKTTENSIVNYTYMDAGEVYESSVIKISGIPNLVATIKSLSYKDMFGQQYVIGYGHGSLEMESSYKFEQTFTTLIGRSPDSA